MIRTDQVHLAAEVRSTPEFDGRRLQILATEHWSLLSTRSLTYSECLGRVVMFLSVLTTSVVALALLAQVDHFRETFTFAAIFMLDVVLFVGVTTIVRLAELNQEDMRLVLGMNRLRRGYLDMHPELEPYFLAGSHDDLGGLMLTLGMNMAPSRLGAHELAHQFQTLPGMLGVIVAAVAGVLAALMAVVFGAPTSLTVLVTASAFLICAVMLQVLTRHAFNMFARDMTVRFPSMGQQSISSFAD